MNMKLGKQALGKKKSPMNMCQQELNDVIVKSRNMSEKHTY